MSRRARVCLWRRWRDDRRGVAAVEFALIMPMLLTLYLGGYETAEAVATNRKLADTTTELANVTAQYTTMSANDVSSVMNASSQIMAPYSTQPLTLVVSEITTDANNNATVTWSQAYNGAKALVVGSSASLPAGMATPSTSYILVNSTYTYTPTFGAAFVGTIPMSNQISMLPRQSTSITYTG